MFNLLNVWTLVANLLLRHLESSRSELPGDHLLAAVAAPGALGRLHHRLVVGQLEKKMMQSFTTNPKSQTSARLGWRVMKEVDRGDVREYFCLWMS